MLSVVHHRTLVLAGLGVVDCVTLPTLSERMFDKSPLPPLTGVCME